MMSLVSVNHGMDGELIKIAIFIVGILGGAEVLSEYWMKQKEK